jgi:hypothetical protein
MLGISIASAFSFGRGFPKHRGCGCPARWIRASSGELKCSRDLLLRHCQKAHGALAGSFAGGPSRRARCHTVVDSTARAACANADGSNDPSAFVSVQQGPTDRAEHQHASETFSKVSWPNSKRGIGAHQINPQPVNSTITSDNICHIKSMGVASDWVWILWEDFLNEGS